MRAIVLVLIAFAPTSVLSDERLNGTWEAVRIEENGRLLPAEYLDGVQLTIWQDRYLLTANGTTVKMSFSTDGSDGAGTIDVVPSIGSNAAQGFPGIYKVEGDLLTVAYSSLGGARPSGFDMESAPDARITEWRRKPRRQQAVEGEEIVNSLGMSLRLVLPGTFVMGPEPLEQRRLDEVARRVTMVEPFYMGATEVTIGQFREFVEDTARKGEPIALGPGGFTTVKTGVNQWQPDAAWNNPGFEQTDDHPVVFVSWTDAQAFCDWLSEKEGRTYRLPTEAEWEYAALGSREAIFSWGDQIGGASGHANLADRSYGEVYANRSAVADIDDGYVHTAPVTSFEPNRYGLYDMHGNVFEWVADWWAVPLPGDAIEPSGPNKGEFRVAKGGAWGNTPDAARIAYRFHDSPEIRFAGVGFRVVLVVE